MRLFVALWPSPEAVDDLQSFVAHLRTTITRDADRTVDLRWTDSTQWHLTLTFLGQAAPERLPELEERLARAASRHPALTLRLSGGGRFGDRVLYTRVTGDHERLARLADSVSAAARRTGLSLEERTYRPHLTLARGRPGCDLRPLATGLGEYHGPPWTSTEVHLIHSTLGAGPRRTSVYETIGTWSLTGDR